MHSGMDHSPHTDAFPTRATFTTVQLLEFVVKGNRHGMVAGESLHETSVDEDCNHTPVLGVSTQTTT